MAAQVRRMLQLGVLLALAGLLTGVAVPALDVPRLGLSAHIVGVSGGFFLVGLVPGVLAGECRLLFGEWRASPAFRPY